MRDGKKINISGRGGSSTFLVRAINQMASGQAGGEGVGVNCEGGTLTGVVRGGVAVESISPLARFRIAPLNQSLNISLLPVILYGR